LFLAKDRSFRRAWRGVRGVVRFAEALREHSLSKDEFMHHERMIDEYLAGPKLLQDAVAGMLDQDLDARPVPGKWSTRQVVCHIADFEPIYADRMKRVIAEDHPSFFGGDPDVFAAGLAYEKRHVLDELALVALVRKNMAAILMTLGAEAFNRTGNHSEDGPLTLETLLQRITSHIPHHVRLIHEKRQAMRR
jgi:hypothetical protein